MDVKNENRSLIIDGLFHQYDSLRTEILEHVRALYAFSGAILAAFVSAIVVGITIWSNTLVSSLIFTIIIPIILIVGGFALFINLNEMTNLSNYLMSDVEDVIDILIGEDYRNSLISCSKNDKIDFNKKKIIGWEN